MPEQAWSGLAGTACYPSNTSCGPIQGEAGEHRHGEGSGRPGRRKTHQCSRPETSRPAGGAESTRQSGLRNAAASRFSHPTAGPRQGDWNAGCLNRILGLRNRHAVAQKAVSCTSPGAISCRRAISLRFSCNFSRLALSNYLVMSSAACSGILFN